MTVDAKEMEARLRAFYATHNPGNQQNIAEIVSKYRGKEAVLCAKLRKKYGVAPDLPTTPAITKEASAAATRPPEYDAAYTPFCAPETRDDDPLDFRSPAFDALQALSSWTLRPPVSDGVFPLDNIHKCRRLLPTTDPHYQSVVIGPAQATAKRQQRQATKPAADVTAPKPTLFETLADTYLDGPFSVLRRCFLERKRVRVVLRRVNSVRGVCVGFLKAFDKHMNLVLLDVTEIVIPHGVYERRDRAAAHQERVEPFSVADDARNRSFTVKQFSKQLFVRGDNVVMVMEEPPTSAVSAVTASRASRVHGSAVVVR
ncbi:hypothetical protein PINS_up013935 [Pythium insidiosum]|nr:hypothetical protein PINS_up013935 [Pythium insidiosum]